MNMNRNGITVFLALAVLLISGIVIAQEPQPISLTGLSPQRIVVGQAQNITLSGSGYTDETVVQISNIGTVTSTFISDSTLIATLPATLAAGTYSVSVLSRDGATVSLYDALTVEAEQTPAPVMTIARTEPQRMTSGQQITLSVLGSNFTSETVVRIVGVGLLPTTFVHSGALTATVPNLSAGEYTIEVGDSSGMVAASPNHLAVAAPPRPTQPPQPTAAPQPTATPIPVVFEPLLVLTNFTAQPATIEPGQTTHLTFTVTNHGNQLARAINIALASGSSFVSAGGQANLVIPDLNPGMTYNGHMSVASILNTAAGPVQIPLIVNYQDISGSAYTANAELSVTVQAVSNNSQLVIDAYTVEPSPAQPGQPVTVRMTVANLGNTTASQTLIRFAADNSILLPNGRGNVASIGDIQPRQRIPVQFPLILSASAENGPQLQSIHIEYSQNGETKETTASITVQVEAINTPQPLLVLTEYNGGEEALQPGMRFTLQLMLQNAGQAPARITTVTFGTVTTSGDSNGTDGSGSNSGGQTSTTPSTTFAPLGTAGLVYLGDIEAGNSAEVSQEFIVTNSVNSGVYALPVTLQYLLTDGSSKQETLSVSVVVIVPPRLRITVLSPLSESANSGEPVPLGLQIANAGTSTVNLTHVTVTGTNAEIVDGSESQLEPLKADDDISINGMVMPLEEGDFSATVQLHYIDDLNQEDVIELTYSGSAMIPPPPVDEPIIEEPRVEEPAPEVNWFGRFMMALLGLGS